MSAYQYRFFRTKRVADILPGLNKLGQEGWHVVEREADDVGSDGWCYLLERRKEDVTIAVRQDIILPSGAAEAAANSDRRLPEADAAAAQRGTLRLQPSPPQEVSYDQANVRWLVDGQPVSGPDAEYARVHGRLPERADSLSASSHAA